MDPPKTFALHLNNNKLSESGFHNILLPDSFRLLITLDGLVQNIYHKK